MVIKSEVKKLRGVECNHPCNNGVEHPCNKGVEVIINKNSDLDFQIFIEWGETFVHYQEGMHFRGSYLLKKREKLNSLEGTMKHKEDIHLISSLHYM